MSEHANYAGGIEVITLLRGQAVDLTGEPCAIQMVPTEFYVKPDGAKDDTPSLLIVMRHPRSGVVFGQISYAMLKPVIAELERVAGEVRP